MLQIQNNEVAGLKKQVYHCPINLEVVQYDPRMEVEWDAFINSSNSPVLLFQRRFIEYHKDRFLDNSLMFYSNGKLVAVMPANCNGNLLQSHAGLTFGGIIFAAEASVLTAQKVFNSLLWYCQQRCFNTIQYKQVPGFYLQHPNDDLVEYAIYAAGGVLSKVETGFTIDRNFKTQFQNRRRRGMAKAQSAGIQVVLNSELDAFYNILEEHLEVKFGTRPVHSFSELQQLQKLMGADIQILTTEYAGRTLAGVLLFFSNNVVHTQYIASTPEGRERGALDLLFATLINDLAGASRFISLGTANGHDGVLNESLAEWKESWGARPYSYRRYEIPVAC